MGALKPRLSQGILDEVELRELGLNGQQRFYHGLLDLIGIFEIEELWRMANNARSIGSKVVFVPRWFSRIHWTLEVLYVLETERKNVSPG